MTGAASSEGGRPLAYRLGQLLAIGETVAREEHDPQLMEMGFSKPAEMVQFLAPLVMQRGGWALKRWQAINPDSLSIPARPLDPFGETQLTLGYWHERTHINRAERMARARQNAGLTRAQWAAVLGVGEKLVEGWEYHTRNVSEEHEKLAEIVKERTLN